CYAGIGSAEQSVALSGSTPSSPLGGVPAPGFSGVESCLGIHDVPRSHRIRHAIAPPPRALTPHEFSRPAPSLVDLDEPPLLGLRPYPTIGVGSRVGKGRVKKTAKLSQSSTNGKGKDFTKSLPLRSLELYPPIT